MTINPSSPTHAYLQIADILRRRIIDEGMPDGAPLPSVRELVAQFATAPGTVRQAFAQLTSEGLVVARQGSGAFVRKPRRLRRVGSTRHLRTKRTDPAALPLQAEAHSQGFQRSSDLIGVTRVAAPIVVAERLQLPEGSTLIHRRYQLSLDGEIAQTASSYFPASLAEGTALAEPAPPPGGTHAYLADALGLTLEVATEELTARMPTHPESVTLRLLPGTPVLELIRTIYTSDERPVEVTNFLFAGDRHVFVYTVPLD
ncbi:MAG: GntR family transcriptional regulator [Pseudonocardiaceae bacterium]